MNLFKLLEKVADEIVFCHFDRREKTKSSTNACLRLLPTFEMTKNDSSLI